MPLPLDLKNELGNDKVPQRTWLDMPVIGMEAEFNVWLDGVEIIPEDYWKHPSAFIDANLLARTKKSSQLPTGGAVYFDRGVIEVVTPVIEIAPGCSARVVRNLWEQIGFVRDQLTRWERETGHHVRLKAYSSHYNISFELRKHEQHRYRNIKRLALLLAHILPVPVMVLGCNRRSTGVGVRPRGNRIEVTVDFTPDPGLMIATSTMIVGIVREVLSWNHYSLSLLKKLDIPTIAGVIPGKHTTRKGWLTKDFHYKQSPYTSDIDARIWKTRRGETLSLREMAAKTCWFFRKSIRRWADPFSYRLMFAILDGKAPSMLDLKDRPAAYEDVGRLCRWGMVIHELRSWEAEESLIPARDALWDGGTIEEFVDVRDRERNRFESKLASIDAQYVRAARAKEASGKKENFDATLQLSPEPPATKVKAKRQTAASNRKSLIPQRNSDYVDRRRAAGKAAKAAERRRTERRKKTYAIPFPDRRLTRSAYESVFLKLVSGARLRIGNETYTPIGMKGWYHAIFRRDADGREKLLTIDQLLQKMDDWT